MDSVKATPANSWMRAEATRQFMMARIEWTVLVNMYAYKCLNFDAITFAESCVGILSLA